jgi:hypothetical protein
MRKRNEWQEGRALSSFGRALGENLLLSLKGWGIDVTSASDKHGPKR